MSCTTCPKCGSPKDCDDITCWRCVCEPTASEIYKFEAEQLKEREKIDSN